MQQRSSARSAGNSASLPVGITSWKIDKTQVHEGRGSKARLTGGLEKPEAPRNNEIEPPLFSRREPSSLERLWNNAKSLSTLICQAIASLPSSPPLPRYTRNFEAGDRFSSFPLIRLSFTFFPSFDQSFDFIPLPYKYISHRYRKKEKSCRGGKLIDDEIIAMKIVLLFHKRARNRGIINIIGHDLVRGRTV